MKTNIITIKKYIGREVEVLFEERRRIFKRSYNKLYSSKTQNG